MNIDFIKVICYNETYSIVKGKGLKSICKQVQKKEGL